MSKKALRVFGWQGWRNGSRGSCQTREIVAARSMAAAARFEGASSVLSLDMCETGNEGEIVAATEHPGIVMWHPLDQLDRDRTWDRVDKETES